MRMTPCPKNERVWVSYHTLDGELAYIMTSKKDSRDWYFLYKISNGELKKLGKSKSPAELEEKHHVMEVIRKIE